MSEHDAPHDELEDHDLGLSHDLPNLLDASGYALRGMLDHPRRARRRAAAGSPRLVHHASREWPAGTPPGRRSARRRPAPPRRRRPRRRLEASVADGEIPEETAGPYPGDGSNGAERARPRAASCAATSRSSFGSASRHGRGRAADHRR